ncbi:MAG: DUF445 family protein [Bacteroidota bacterium]
MAENKADKASNGDMAPAEDAGRPGEVVVETLPAVRNTTRERAIDLKNLFSKYIRRYMPERVGEESSFPEPPRMVGSYAQLLPLMRLIPWILAAFFVVSAFWDFDGITFTLFGQTLQLEGLVRIISVSGMIGFLTNWLAITMLFNPRERRPLLGQGLIPEQRERVIYRMASTISEELINADIIKQKIEESGIIPKYREMALSVTKSVIDDPDFREELKGIISNYVDEVVGSEDVRSRLVEFIVGKIEEYAGEGLGGFALRTYRMINEGDFQRRIEDAVEQLPSSVDTFLDEMDHLLDAVPEKIEARSQDIEQAASAMITTFVDNIDLYSMIESNMQRYDDRKLEELLKRATNEQLNYIKYLGGVLGCIGGLVIWQPTLSLIAFGIIGSILYGIDELLYRRQKRLQPAEEN